MEQTTREELLELAATIQLSDDRVAQARADCAGHDDGPGVIQMDPFGRLHRRCLTHVHPAWPVVSETLIIESTLSREELERLFPGRNLVALGDRA